MNQFYTRSKAAFFILFVVLCLPLSMHAQTFFESWAFLTWPSGPVSVAIDAAGNVYSTNFDKSTVSKITPTGAFTNTIVQAWATLPSNAKPIALAIDLSGNVYTVNFDLTVCKIAPNGTVTQTWDLSPLYFGLGPRGLAIDAAGNVYVASISTNTISKITAAGVLTLNWKTVSGNPTAIAIDAAGNLYTANNASSTVSKITAAGVVIDPWATLTPGSGPLRIILDLSGNLYTSNHDNSTVSKITAAGVVTPSWATLASNATPIGIGIDLFGNIYTSNYGNSTVSKIIADGSVYPSWATLDSEARPNGLAVDLGGNVYTANQGGSSVGKIINYPQWIGGASTNIANSANWYPSVAPTAADNIVIPTTLNPPTLSANLTVNSLAFAGSNKVVLGNNTLTVNSIINGSSANYVVTNGTGGVKMATVGTIPTLFPVGPSVTEYAPVTITNNMTNNFTVKVGTAITSPIVGQKYVNLQWDITPTVPIGNTATLALGWSAGSQAAGFSPTSAVQVNHYSTTTSSWDMSKSAVIAGSNPYTATASGFSSFSPFTVSNVAVLPVELLSFSGKNREGSNFLTWETASEVNNKGFEVERRQATGDSWDNIGFKTANNKASTYQFTDNSPLTTSYYRLRQIDNDGTETYSKIVSVVQTGKGKGLAVYPNPVSSLLTIEVIARNEATEGASFQILNLLGQQVLTGKTAQRIDVSALPQGTYILKVGAEQAKFIKK
jgi:streptogramin lyase